MGDYYKLEICFNKRINFKKILDYLEAEGCEIYGRIQYSKEKLLKRLDEEGGSVEISNSNPDMLFMVHCHPEIKNLAISMTSHKIPEEHTKTFFYKLIKFLGTEFSLKKIEEWLGYNEKYPFLYENAEKTFD